MLIAATPMRHYGRPVSKKELESATPARGDLIIGQEKSTVFGRHSDVAGCHTSGATDKQPLPPLHDAALSWMGPNGFVLTGIEVVDGVTYGQSWWCRPAQ